MAQDFTFSNVDIVVQGIANYLIEKGVRDQGIIIGHDTRFLAENFARNAAQIMIAAGIKVFIGAIPLPTPVTAYAIKMHNTAGALMFTASHNPPEYNGIKFIPEYAGPATPEITKELEKHIAEVINSKSISKLSLDKGKKDGLLEEIDPRGEYRKHLENVVDFNVLRSNPLTAIVDPMYGAGMGYVSEYLREVGWQVKAIHETRDTLFGGSLPEPVEAKLTELKELVLEQGANIGLANDGDADRFGIIDNKGNYISPNQVLTLLLLHLAKNRKMKGAIVRTVATTHLLDEIAKDFGVPIYETPVGFKYVGKLMLEEDVLIGGEESGGLSIKGHIPEKDGILANLLMAELCSTENKELMDIWQEVIATYGDFRSKRVDLHLEEEKKIALLEALRNSTPTKFGKFVVQEFSTKDGIKLLLSEDAWVLFRPSGTEPLLRIYLEAKSKDNLEALEEAVLEYLG